MTCNLPTRRLVASLIATVVMGAALRTADAVTYAELAPEFANELRAGFSAADLDPVVGERLLINFTAADLVDLSKPSGDPARVAVALAGLTQPPSVEDAALLVKLAKNQKTQNVLFAMGENVLALGKAAFAFSAVTDDQLARASLLVADSPAIAAELGSLKKVGSALQYAIDNGLVTGPDFEPALIGQRVLDLDPRASVGVLQALRRTHLRWDEITKLSEKDARALTATDIKIVASMDGRHPGDPDLTKLGDANQTLAAVTSVSPEVAAAIRAELGHVHGMSDPAFLVDPVLALSQRFSKVDTELLRGIHRDTLRALEGISDVNELMDVLNLIREAKNPKDPIDMLRSYMYKAQKLARRQGGVLVPPQDVGKRLALSLANLRQARERGYPFGFADVSQYQAFAEAMRVALATRGIDGVAKVQGSAMHSQTPGDVDVEILVSRAEFDRLAKIYLGHVATGKLRSNLEDAIARAKIPSFFFYGAENPSVAHEVMDKLRAGSGFAMDVQATLIVKDSDFDLGPFLDQ
jgi:hypothetical protein